MAEACAPAADLKRTRLRVDHSFSRPVSLTFGHDAPSGVAFDRLVFGIRGGRNVIGRLSGLGWPATVPKAA